MIFLFSTNKFKYCSNIVLYICDMKKLFVQYLNIFVYL